MTLFFDFLQIIQNLLQYLIQVGMLAAIIYTTLLFIKGTRAEPILIGIVMTILGGWFFAHLLGLEVIQWILTKLPALMVFAMLIIFQPEIRRAFAEIGINPHRFIKSNKRVSKTIDSLIETSYNLGGKHIGALIAVERDIGMRSYTESGVQINAPISVELLMTIFHPNTPLHDGAVVIKNGIILSASCFFPLTQTQLSRTLGTRHRAGIGITEETDSIVIIVSEEDGNVSVAKKGRLVKNIDKERLRRHLINFLLKEKPKTVIEQTSITPKEKMVFLKNLLIKRKRG